MFIAVRTGLEPAHGKPARVIRGITLPTPTLPGGRWGSRVLAHKQ